MRWMKVIVLFSMAVLLSLLLVWPREASSGSLDTIVKDIEWRQATAERLRLLAEKSKQGE